MKKKNYQVTTYQGVWFYDDDTPVLYDNWDEKQTISNTSNFMDKKEASKLVSRIMAEFPKVTEVIVIDWTNYTEENKSYREITYVRTT